MLTRYVPSYPGVVLEVKPEYLELQVGQTAELAASVLNQQDQRVSFSSNQPAIATVTNDGEVRAMRGGETVIEVQSVGTPTLKTLVPVKIND